MKIISMYRVLSGKDAADAILLNLKRRVQSLPKKPSLVIILVGEDPASELYVNNKIKKAESIGINANLIKLPENVPERELLDLVEKLNNDKEIDGFIVQAPLPQHINQDRVINAISPEKDVDGWTITNLGKLFVGMPGFLPATPAGVIRLLEYYNIPIEKKHAVVVGRSNVVGKPLAILLLRKNATVTICHSKTEKLSEHTKQADILIVAAGKEKLITADMVKQDAVVIDVGINKTEAGFVGDVDFNSVIKKASCTPVPGGVGPMTVAMLLENVVEAAEKNVRATGKAWH
ncbi:MAG: bifunctional 5,10-methylenetetrahydrofolate dehydrogenase/5,10-methenyltetrahydrofolate cyclohydrolase [Candidatus Bilamarchaeaceae archaeon]